nr:MAG TPA: hypothetical protein [Caudoviricetes sp.]
MNADSIRRIKHYQTAINRHKQRKTIVFLNYLKYHRSISVHSCNT